MRFGNGARGIHETVMGWFIGSKGSLATCARHPFTDPSQLLPHLRGNEIDFQQRVNGRRISFPWDGRSHPASFPSILALAWLKSRRSPTIQRSDTRNPAGYFCPPILLASQETTCAPFKVIGLSLLFLLAIFSLLR